MFMATARQQQQQHGNSPLSGSGSEHKKKGDLPLLGTVAIVWYELEC